MAFDHAPLGLREKRTRHRGQLYQSKLAAQWAAFLSAMRIAYVYEAETFAVSPGVYVTPTFWLPQLRTWLEVRPAGEDRDAGRGCDDSADGVRKDMDLAAGRRRAGK